MPLRFTFSLFDGESKPWGIFAMKEGKDAAYFEKRAREERDRAERAETAEATIVHNQLADAYEEKARQLRGQIETD